MDKHVSATILESERIKESELTAIARFLMEEAAAPFAFAI
jgi:hypothetical protein